MKTKLLKISLCGAMLLPIVAIADEQPQPMDTNPKWQSIKTDKATYGVDAFHVVTSSNMGDYFDIQCNPDQSLELNIAFMNPLDSQKNKMDIQWILDKKDKLNKTFLIRQENTVASMNQPMDFLQKLYTHKMISTTIDFQEIGKQTIEFDIENLEKTIQQLKTNCKK